MLAPLGPVHVPTNRAESMIGWVIGRNPWRSERQRARTPHQQCVGSTFTASLIKFAQTKPQGTSVLSRVRLPQPSDRYSQNGATVLNHTRADGPLDSRFGRYQRIALASALAWAAGLVMAAALVPVYQSSSVSSSGAVVNGSATLVGVNGWGVLLLAGAPLAAALVIWYALWGRRGRQGAGILAWVVTALLIGFNVLAMLSIGVFLIPVTLALVVACSTHGNKPPGAITRSGVPS
jgi:hypothetical protein